MIEPPSESPRRDITVEYRKAWLTAARMVPAFERIALIDAELKSLLKTVSGNGIFFRKELLRFQDESRLEAGLVTREELQGENSPFEKMDFLKARIVFSPRRKYV